MRRSTIRLGLILAFGIPAASAWSRTTPPPPPPSVADTLILRDGKTLLGQVINAPQTQRGGTRLIVRREWAKANLPDWATRWETAEKADLTRARKQRKERLTRWKAERGSGTDRLTQWIDRELAALDAPPRPSTLLVVNLPRADIRQTRKADPKSLQSLRLAWSAGLADPETKTFDDLKSGLESRGLLIDDPSPVDLTALLPPTIETENEWLRRRGATEVINDEGLRFLKQGTLVFPEPAPGEIPSAELMIGAAGEAIKGLLDDRPASDPMLPYLKKTEARRRVGLVVTEVDLGAGNGPVRAGFTLWIKTPEGWTAGVRRSTSMNPGQMNDQAAARLLEDPQVAAIFRLADSLGAGSIDPALKRRSLATGEAARQALGTARSDFQGDLESLDLSGSRASAIPAPKPKP